MHLNILKFYHHRSHCLLILTVVLLFLLEGGTIFAETGNRYFRVNLDTKWQEEITSGRSRTFEGTITNISAETLSNIIIASPAPKRGRVEIEPQIIPSIAPGEARSFTVQIDPGRSLFSDKYRVVVRVSSGNSEYRDYIHVRVSARNIWLPIAAVLVLIVISLFVFIFLRLERKQSGIT